MDQHSTQEAKHHTNTKQPWTQNFPILNLTRKCHTRPHHSKTIQDITPKPYQMINVKKYSRCRRWIHFVNASPNAYQIVRYQTWCQTIHTCKGITIQTHQGCKSEIYDTHHTKSLEVYGTSRSAWQTLTPRSILYILSHQMTILLEGNKKEYQEIYISNCTLCHRENAKVNPHPLQMTEILDKPFDNIPIGLVTECKTSNSVNKHILTIIDYLTGWPEAFHIPDRSADTILSMFINHYLPVHMCPRYILSHNGTEFKNQLMDQVLQQLGIDCIFSAPYHSESNRKLEVLHKYLKPTLKKLCEKDLTNWNKYINQVLASYWVTPNLAMAETPFFLDFGRDPNLPLHQILEPMQCFLGAPESGRPNLETHCLH